MKTMPVFALLMAFTFVPSAHAEQMTAEKLVSSMKKADMTYRQLMEVMGNSYIMMHEGILRENKQMVEVGANFILTHPAPNHKPWTIMKEEDQEGFKQSLLTFDKILENHSIEIVEAAKNENWMDANKASHDLMNSCLACHTMWRNKVK